MCEFRRRFSAGAVALVAACVLASAAHAAWPANPVTVANAATLRSVLPDGAGGALFVWLPDGGDSTRVLRLLADGSAALGWPAGGRGVTTMAYLGAAADGQGGAYLLFTKWYWVEVGFEYARQNEYWAFHLDASGAAAANYPLAGKLVYTDLNYRAVGGAFATGDGQGGAYLVWTRDVLAGDHNTTMYQERVAAHLFAAGTWNLRVLGAVQEGSAAGLAVDGGGGLRFFGGIYGDFITSRWAFHGAFSQATLFHSFSGLVTPGLLTLAPSADALVSWRTSPYTPPDTSTFRMVRVDSMLQLRPGWPAGGQAFAQVPFLGDGQGGAFVAADLGGPVLQRVTLESPAPVQLWPEGSLPPWRPGTSVADGEGGVFECWTTSGVPPGSYLWATRVSSTGHYEAQWSGDGVLLSSVAQSPWQVVNVGPGTAVAAWTEQGTIVARLLADEASTAVPPPAGALAFALRGFTTNPLVGEAAVEFTLPDGAPAVLEAFDVAGRRLAHREIGALGAGTHRVALPELRAARAGLVFARLTRAGEVRTARATRLR